MNGQEMETSEDDLHCRLIYQILVEGAEFTIQNISSFLSSFER